MNWETAYDQMKKELKHEPTTNEAKKIQQRMLKNAFNLTKEKHNS